jgi:hypothetical protein
VSYETAKLTEENRGETLCDLALARSSLDDTKSMIPKEKNDE